MFTSKWRISIANLMAEVPKIDTWQKIVQTYGDAIIEIWNSAWSLLQHCQPPDFIYDLCTLDSIKPLDRQRKQLLILWFYGRYHTLHGIGNTSPFRLW